MMELTVKLAVALLASHSRCISESTREPMDLQVMAESWPLVALPGEKAAGTESSSVGGTLVYLPTATSTSPDGRKNARRSDSRANFRYIFAISWRYWTTNLFSWILLKVISMINSYCLVSADRRAAHKIKCLHPVRRINKQQNRNTTVRQTEQWSRIIGTAE